MNKLVLSLAAVAILFAADASARCCARERRCGAERVCDVRPVEACCEPVAPICKVPCVTYKQVPAIRHVSYSCPTACLTEAQLDGHMEKIRTTHDADGIQVEILA